MRQFRAYKLQAAAFLRSGYEQSHTFGVEEEIDLQHGHHMMAGGK
jgi:hypothetical protein